MKYLIHMEVPVETGKQIDMKGGPGPILREIGERFHPECVYGEFTRRGLWMVMDLPDPVQIGALMVICTEKLGCYPTFLPVVGAAEMVGFVAAVHQAAGVGSHG